MKTPVLFLLLTILLCAVAQAQSEATMALDVRPGLSENTGLARLASRSAASNDREVRAPESDAAATLERKVFSMLNSERRAQGLAELMWSDEVAAVARLHSRNMAEKKFFGHRGTDGSMVDERADRVGLGSWRTIGENIAYMRGYHDPAALAVEKWMESTAHRNNLLAPNWKESAVGVAITADGTYYLTQVFLLRK